MNRTLLTIFLAAVAMVGCTPILKKSEHAWTAREITAIGNCMVPECVMVDPSSGLAYVSQIETTAQGYWEDDGTGSIGVLRPGGEPVDLRWRTSTPDAPLNAPKGMCIIQAILYVADNTRVVAYRVDDKSRGTPLAKVTGQRLNDMATDGVAGYVSDTAAGKVYRFDAQGVREIKAPEGVNGLTFFQGKMYAVSWTKHDIYELDPSGKDDPRPFGLARHFRTLDGIEVLDDGSFVVSDFEAGRVALVSPDRRTVTTLLVAETPADIGLDRQRMLLYVPKLTANQVSVYQLRKK